MNAFFLTRDVVSMLQQQEGLHTTPGPTLNLYWMTDTSM